MALEGGPSQAVSTAAALFTWGANSYGQLGLGHKEDVFMPQRLSDFCRPGCIRSVTGGGGHSAAVTDGGGLFVCGLNKDGQLGLGHTEEVLCFTICKPLVACPIRQVACGWDFTIMLTEKGQVLSCGSNAFGQLGVPHGPRKCVVPRAIECLREEVACVAAGLRHALATTVSGSVFQWGTGLASSGQRLCPGKTLPLFLTAKEPSRVTDTGELYVWGSNKHGQLASLAAFLLLPQRIEARCFQDEKVTAVWSGWTHLVAQTETGKVFTWGRADYGQLGRRLESPEGQKSGEHDASLAFWRPRSSVPSPLHCLTGAAEVACGSEHNLAVISGRCCSWGWNEHGMCGDGTEASVCTPTPVLSLSGLLLVGCGAGHSFAVCQLPVHPVLCRDPQVTSPLPDATENPESRDAVDREKPEGETIRNFNPKQF
ncbi:secretion-regulating guanine nucleotide exchange factor isoform X3 [Meriones unguiculatus]|uniref:secretion-regulating guanine nucleotide exchange factor isoform X3 n=1 Tax=Meriones unguiculatus TaxID=10047 RepID=UPI00293F4FA9|nr:secretion-regulating guanine nucleotide exchange factor isoform X3 [Meriones unguiculatus]